MVDGRTLFDGCLELAIKTELIIVKNNTLFLCEKTLSLNNKEQIINELIERLFISLQDDIEFQKIFSSTFLSYDFTYKSLQINNQAFGLKHSSFKQLLIDFKVLRPHPTIQLNCFIINNRYKNIFDKTILPEIKRREIGVDEFRKAMEQQQIYGEEAERFVLNFEYLRLKKQKEINWVAEYIVNAGYDIASYNFTLDETPNRFIEVKSYDGEIPYFYWSKNEFSEAKLRKQEYWLYLVNRKEINDVNYEPIMIQNPYESVYQNKKDWMKEIEKLYLKAI